MRTLITCAGIGDFLWLAMKLINTGERFNIIMPDTAPQRGHQLAELLPDLINKITYQSGWSYNKIRHLNAQRHHGTWDKIKGDTFVLEANSHLEAGRRIERFLPDLPTTYRLPYPSNPCNYPSDLIAIYTSAYSNARHWGMWGADQWNELLDRLSKQYILIGAPYDVGIDLSHRTDVVSSVGEPLPVVVEILKRSKYFVGFPSGLSILAETIGTPNFMHYPEHLAKMVNAWADPARIDKEYIGRVNATVDEVYNLIKDKC